MSPKPREVLRPSLLARLLGGDAGKSHAHWEHDQSARDLEREVTQHLELLLNTRVLYPDCLDRLPEAQDSLLTYGLPELCGLTGENQAQMHRIRDVIRDTIRRFEPRLDPKSVKVSLLERDEDYASAKFRIEAVLLVEPVRLDVIYDTKVDLTVGQVTMDRVHS